MLKAIVIGIVILLPILPTSASQGTPDLPPGGEPPASKPEPAEFAAEMDPRAGLFILPTVSTVVPRLGEPTFVSIHLSALEDVGDLRVVPPMPHSHILVVEKGAVPATMPEGSNLTLAIEVTSSEVGDYDLDWRIEATIRGVPVVETAQFHLHMDPDPTRSNVTPALTPPLLKAPEGLVEQPISIPASMNAGPTFASNRAQKVVFVSGYNPNGLGVRDVAAEWRQFSVALQTWGWLASNMVYVGIEQCDKEFTWHVDTYGISPDVHNHALGGRSLLQNHGGGGATCGWTLRPMESSHNQQTGIEHEAYHLAWAARAKLGTQCFDVVAHSMGGLIVRYAVASIQRGDAEFPHDLCIDDVITMGTPHGGSDWALACPDHQCVQMRPSSGFLNGLGTNLNPRTQGITEWTAMGSPGDEIVGADRATRVNFDPEHWVIYDDVIGHSQGRHWRNAVASDITANIRWKDKTAIGIEKSTVGAPWPARFADLSLAYSHWGCGGNTAETPAWPLAANRGGLIAEAYTTTTNCWYSIDVLAGQGSLSVGISSRNGHDIDLFLYYGSPSSTPVCAQYSVASSHTCTQTNPAAGRWYVEMRNYARTRDPFDVTASVTAGSSVVVVRDDDGSPEYFLPYNHHDDVARKRLVLPSTILTGATSAKLWIYAQSGQCGLEGNNMWFYVNSQFGGEINPCNGWSSTSPHWRDVIVPLPLLVAGTTNTFELKQVSGDWTDRNFLFGMDRTNDFARSDALHDGIDERGELMWYLEVRR